MDTITKEFSADMTVDAGERSFIAEITNNAIDRDNEVVLPEGMDATDFEKNPVIFWNHEYSAPPIGKAVSLKREKTKWLAKGVMASRPDTLPKEAEWFPDTLLHLMDEGIVNGVSVGIDPTAPPRNASEGDRSLFGPEVQRVIHRWKILEFSVTPMPANQDALVQAVGKGLIRPETVKSYFGIDVPEQEQPQEQPESEGGADPPAVEPAAEEPARSHKAVVLMVPARKRLVVPVAVQPKLTGRNVEESVRKAMAKKIGLIYLPGKD